MSKISPLSHLPDIILFNDPAANEDQLELQKKEGLMRITARSGFGQSMGQAVTKNPLHENEHLEDDDFVGSYRKSPNPEKNNPMLESQAELGYQPGQRRSHQKFLPPLLKTSSNKREQIRVLHDGADSARREQQSSAQIVMNEYMDQYSPAKTSKRLTSILYRIPNPLPDRKSFLLNPIPPGLVLQCSIRRDKSTFGKKFYTEYALQLSEDYQFLAAAKRMPYHCTSTYCISLENSFDLKDRNCIGQVSSNFWGSVFEIRDARKNEVAGTVYYEGNCCKSEQGPRKMEATVFTSNQARHEETLGVVSSESPVTQLQSKKARYDSVRNAYIMKFNNRVKMSSVKNFILVNQANSEKNILLFGKANKEMFNMDICYPFSPMQAFAVALTSFDSKLVSK